MRENMTLTIVTVAAFDQTRLQKTMESTKGLGPGVEHLFVIPEADSIARKIIEEYKVISDFAVRYVHDKKQGIYAAMNIGAENSEGNFIHFLNAGDLVQNPTALMSNIVDLEERNPNWAITGVSLPWNSSYVAYEGMESRFRRQHRDGYVSHQSVFVRNDIFKSLGGFDTKFPIAADTKMIYQLSSYSKPLILDGIVFDVEEGFNVTSHNRESRLEVFKIINSVGNFFEIVISDFNFLRREIRFLLNKLQRKLG